MSVSDLLFTFKDVCSSAVNEVVQGVSEGRGTTSACAFERAFDRMLQITCKGVGEWQIQLNMPQFCPKA